MYYVTNKETLNLEQTILKQIILKKGKRAYKENIVHVFLNILYDGVIKRVLFALSVKYLRYFSDNNQH